MTEGGRCNQMAELVYKVGKLNPRYLLPVDVDVIAREAKAMSAEVARLGLDTIDRCRVIAPKRVDAS